MKAWNLLQLQILWFIVHITENLFKRPQIYFGFMNVILLHSDHRHVSATPVAVFSVVRARIKMCFSVRITPQLKIIQLCLQVFHRADRITAHQSGS